MNIRELSEKHRETAQLVYGVVLIVLIPLLIAFNTVFIIKQYNQSMDAALQRQALSLGRAVATLMKGDLPWEVFIQARLGTLMESNPEIMELSVLRPDEEEFKVVASSNQELVGEMTDSYYYKLAWLQPAGGGLATDSSQFGQARQAPDFSAPLQDERFWLVAIPMLDANDEKQALLAIKVSSEVVDELTRYNRNASIYLLAGTVIVVVLFLMVAVRLWDYVLLYRKTKEVDRMKDEFISMASHELRTPVTGIRGYTAMMLEGSLGELSGSVKDSLKKIMNASERLTVLVEDLLNVGRIEQGRIAIESKPLDIGPALKDIISELQIQAKDKGLYLNFKPFADKLPLVNIDPARLKQIMVNLIGNAIKYTGQGGVEVIIEQNRPRFLDIKVKDTGIGMSAKDRERLFEKFYRVKNERTAGITGTGLGLWITKKLIELMQGTIEVDSIENVGTQITVRFPVVKK